MVWRRLWLGLPLAYKLVLLGLLAIMTVTAAVLVGTYASAGDSLKVQLERQLSRDLNVGEKWYRARLEELQLTAVGLTRHDDMGSLLAEEAGRLQLDVALQLDAEARLPDGRRFDPRGIVSEALARREQIVATEAWSREDVAPLPDGQAGLVRLVVSPILRGGKPRGALLLGDWVGGSSAVPKQLVALIGGGVAIANLDRIVASSGFPGPPALAPEVWADVREGRYFYTEAELHGRTYLLALRPLVDHQGTTIGAFVRGFPESEITETLQSYAGGISLLASAAVLFSLIVLLALTRRVLQAEQAVEHDRLRGQLIERIIMAQEDERKRIARELHDQTGQALTGLLVGLKALENATSPQQTRNQVADLRALTLATLEEVHQLSVALRPAMLDDLGLVVALRALVKSFGTQHGIAARCQAEALEDRLPSLWEVTLYRIAQEALTNVAKYAGAREVEVTLKREGERLTLAIVDDGQGFDPGRVAEDGREHLGLLGMQERVALIGGTLAVDSTPGRGTRIEASVRLKDGTH